MLDHCLFLVTVSWGPCSLSCGDCLSLPVPGSDPQSCHALIMMSRPNLDMAKAHQSSVLKHCVLQAHSFSFSSWIRRKRGFPSFQGQLLESLKPMLLIFFDPTLFSLFRVLISQLFILLSYFVISFYSAFKYALVSPASEEIKVSLDSAAST